MREAAAWAKAWLFSFGFQTRDLPPCGAMPTQRSNLDVFGEQTRKP
jgi:hypothetical protein